MTLTVYHVDPNPDTVIRLQNPKGKFADWDGYLHELAWDLQGDKEEYKPHNHESAVVSSVTIPKTPGWKEIARKARKKMRLAAWGKRRYDGVGVQDPHLRIPKSGTAEERKQANQVEQFDGEYTEYHVSSRHLSLASPVFKHMLSGGWKEGTRDEADQFYHLSAADWDPEAFLILMYIFHTRNRDVPRTIDLEMLAKMAVLIDYYECSEAVEVFSGTWVRELSEAVPTTCCREVILWLCVATVFRMPRVYRKATQVALRYSTEELPTFELPIRSTTIDAIEEIRGQTIGRIVTRLHELLNQFREPSYRCVYGQDVSFECGAMRLGALTKDMHVHGLLFPALEAPFLGLSIDDVCSKLRSMRSPSWMDRYRYGFHNCNVKSQLSEMMTMAEKEVEGLDLEGEPRLMMEEQPTRVKTNNEQASEVQQQDTVRSGGQSRPRVVSQQLWEMAYVSTFSP